MKDEGGKGRRGGGRRKEGGSGRRGTEKIIIFHAILLAFIIVDVPTKIPTYLPTGHPHCSL